MKLELPTSYPYDYSEVAYHFRSHNEAVKKAFPAGMHIKLLCLDSLEKTIDRLFADYQLSGHSKSLEDLAPYFGTCWPASRVLTQYLLDHYQGTWNRLSILELGCGLALPSLVLSKLPLEITCQDFHPDVPILLSANKELNKLETFPKFQFFDWNECHPSSSTFDMIIAADVLYEKHSPLLLFQLMSKILKTNGVLILSDPGRPYLQPLIDLARQKDMIVTERIYQNQENETAFIVEFRNLNST